jgi:Tol biopolymer transport system component
VHRDLKPGNVMLTKSGVKLLDFGLAKVAAKEMDVAISNLPTRLAVQPLTEKGTVLGTFQYMAPEQLEGKEADPRADIFALGAVLHEMATGKKAFSGTSQASLIAAILSSDPPAISAIQKMSPPALDRLVRTCLAKDPDERWQSAHDVAEHLRWIAEGGSTVGAPAAVVSRRKSRERVAWTLAALASAAALALLGARLASPRSSTRVLRLSLRPPESPVRHVAALTPSPDGRRLAFVGWEAPGKSALYVRALDAPAAQRIAGTEGALDGFWSPDGRSLGFFADAKLKRVDLAGGPARVLADAKAPHGGCWTSDDTILFSSGNSATDVLLRIPAAGGTPVAVSKLTGNEEAHRWPSAFPDGSFVFLGDAPTTADHSVRLGRPGTLEAPRLLSAVSNVHAVAPDVLLYVRAHTLLAQRVDTKSARLVGEPIALGQNVRDIGENHQFDFGAGGDVLAYQSFAPERRLVWFDRTGARVGTAGEPALYGGPFRISPDGRRVAFEKLDADGRSENLWTLDLERGVVTRVTSVPGGDRDPVWSADGERILFSTLRNNTQGDLFVAPSGGGGPETRLASPGPPFALRAWTRDGTAALVDAFSDATKADVMEATLSGTPALTPIVQTSFNEGESSLSPDERWIAYASDESGTGEVYVKERGGSRRVQVSKNGGRDPRWRSDGRELFFAGGGMVMSVDVTSSPRLALSEPRALFPIPKEAFGYDVAPDGRRFLVALPADEERGPELAVVVGWKELLR